MKKFVQPKIKVGLHGMKITLRGGKKVPVIKDNRQLCAILVVLDLNQTLSGSNCLQIPGRIRAFYDHESLSMAYEAECILQEIFYDPSCF